MKPWIIMRKGIRLNKSLEQKMILVVGSGILIGVIFHDQMPIFKPLVPYLFAFMTFAVAVNCGSNDFKAALKKPASMLSILSVLHIVLPILATILAKLFLPNDPLLQAGVILGTAAPIGIASTIWTSISGGNSALGLTAVVADTLISPVIVPIIMLLTIGQSVQFDVIDLIVGLFWMIVLPTIIGMIYHDRTKGRIGKQVKFVSGPLTKIFLAIVIATNLSVAWGSLHLLKTSLTVVFIIVFIMGCSGYLLGYALAKLQRLPSSLVNTYIFGCGMRNITAGLVMALKYFPELTAIPVVFAIMFQQPMAALSLKFLTEKEQVSK